MKAFELTDYTAVTLIHANPYKEKHGEANVQAITLTVEQDATNDRLNVLHPRMQDMLFFSAAAEAGQTTAEGVPETKPNLRCPLVKQPLKLDLELSGYTVTIDRGLGDEQSNLELYGCTLDDFRVHAVEGGSVSIRWHISSNEKLTPELVGTLCDMAGGEIEITQIAPKPKVDGQTIDGTTKAFQRDHPLFDGAGGTEGEGGDPAEEVDATDAFLAAMGAEPGSPEGGGGQGGETDSEGGETDISLAGEEE